MLKNPVISTTSGGETRTIFLLDINDNEETVIVTKQSGEPVVTKAGKTIALPYKLTFAEKGSKTELFSEDSLPSLRAREWNTKFYVGKDNYIKASNNNALMFLYTIFAEKTQHQMEPKFNLESLVGFEFEAAIVEFENNVFIDWVRTLQANNIKIPTAQELGMPAAVTDNTTVVNNIFEKKTEEFLSSIGETPKPAWKK